MIGFGGRNTSNETSGPSPGGMTILKPILLDNATPGATPRLNHKQQLNTISLRMALPSWQRRSLAARTAQSRKEKKRETAQEPTLWRGSTTARRWMDAGTTPASRPGPTPKKKS